MPLVYVAGPVIRPIKSRPVTAIDRQAERIYADISNEGAWATIVLPKQDAELEDAEASDFFDKIADRILASDAVISVMSEDLSSAVEATVAAMNEKPQLIVAMPGVKIPRLVSGLPAVTKVVDSESPDFGSQLRKFVMSIQEPEAV
jgi:hypothetical protein